MDNKNWLPVLDDRGEVSRVTIIPILTRKPAFTDGQLAYQGFIELPCGDTYRAWWPIFTEWFVAD